MAVFCLKKTVNYQKKVAMIGFVFGNNLLHLQPNII